jgi:hypothetical protein
MSKKFHIKNDGSIAECKAVKGKCPFGDEAEHYSTKELAYEAFQTKMEKESLQQGNNHTSEKAENLEDNIKKLWGSKFHFRTEGSLEFIDFNHEEDSIDVTVYKDGHRHTCKLNNVSNYTDDELYSIWQDELYK